MAASARASSLAGWIVLIGLSGIAPARQEPTTSRDTVALLDLRTLPKLNVDREFVSKPTTISYFGKASVAGGMAFYNAELLAQGWKETRGVVSAPDTKEYADHTYEKNGYRIRLTLGASGDDGMISVSLSHLGNVDVSKLVKPPGAKALAEPIPTSAQYDTPASVEEAASECVKALKDAGWREFESFHPLPKDPASKNVMLEFLKNGSHVTFLSGSYPQVRDGRTMAGYLLAEVLPHDMPVADDASAIQLDTQGSKMSYRTAWEPDRVAEFYRSAYGKLGWKDMSPENTRQDGGAMVLIDDDKDTRLIIQVQTQQEGGTLVKIEPTFRPNLKVARADPEPKPEPAKQDDRPVAEGDDTRAMLNDVNAQIKATADKIKAETGVDVSKQIDEIMKADDKPGEPVAETEPATAFLAAEDVPLPPSARTVARDSARKKITYASADDAKAQEAFFKDELGKKGWDAVSTSRSTFNKSVNLSIGFSKDGQSIDVEVDYNGDKGAGTTTITGDGLRFAAADPDSAPPAANSIEVEDSHGLPVPKETTSKTSESTPFMTSIEAHTSATLEELTKLYRNELSARGWKETAPTAKPDAAKAMLAFAREGNSLAVTLTGGDDATITLVERKTAEARKAGMLAPAGRCRLAIGNQLAKEVVVTINGKPYKVGAGMGAKELATAMKLDLFPGKNQVVVKLPGQKDQKEVVETAAGEAWGLIILDDGVVLPLRLY